MSLPEQNHDGQNDSVENVGAINDAGLSRCERRFAELARRARGDVAPPINVRQRVLVQLGDLAQVAHPLVAQPLVAQPLTPGQVPVGILAGQLADVPVRVSHGRWLVPGATAALSVLAASVALVMFWEPWATWEMTVAMWCDLPL